MSDQFASLLAALRAIPDLPGAACLGFWDLFDEAEPGEPPAAVTERHEAALAMCETCPALAACTTWFESLRPTEKPFGVIAGRRRLARRSPTTPRKKRTAA